VNDSAIGAIGAIGGDDQRPTPMGNYTAMRSYSIDSRCGAASRTGSPCRAPGSGRGGRCRFHGGASTGPTTPQGRARIADAQRQRWARFRAASSPITVRILVRETHDGFGGVHRAGDTPRLPVEVARLLITLRHAEVLGNEMTLSRSDT